MSKAEKISNLRLDAEARLKEGSAPPSTTGMSTNAGFALLHRLSSNPASADDALKLLHELQVHQVELDLQHEQLEDTRRETADELARYQGLYQFAPVGYFNVGGDGEIIDGNLAGADLFGVSQEELPGRRIDHFLAPPSRPVLLELLKRVLQSGSRAACEVKSGGDATASRQWHALAGPAGGDRGLLLAVVDLGPSRAP